MTGDDRIQALRGMLERRSADPRLKFGLALELLKNEETGEAVVLLREYLSEVEDEGNAWGRLGAALDELGRRDEAREAYRKGVEAARRHGHPTMAEEFRTILSEWEEGG